MSTHNIHVCFHGVIQKNLIRHILVATSVLFGAICSSGALMILSFTLQLRCNYDPFLYLAAPVQLWSFPLPCSSGAIMILSFTLQLQCINLYHSLGIFSRWQIDDIFLIFSKKQDLTFHANCLRRRQFAWNIISCFLWKIRKIFQNVICWKFYPEC